MSKSLRTVLLYNQLAVYITTLSLFLASCEGDVSGGEQQIFADETPPGGIIFRVSNAGTDSGDGVTQPFATLQYALDQLRPGDTLIVEQGVYSSTDRIGDDIGGRELQGFVISNSGAPDAPIIIEGEVVQSSGLRPIINQLQTNSNMANPAVIGLYLDCVSHIVVRNLEIRNANEAGISSAINGNCETTNVVIENNYIHDIYGEKYVGGIRLMGASEIVVRDNQIENIFSNAAIQDREMFSIGSGVQNILIEGNQFALLDAGILVNAQGLGDPSILGGQEEPVSGLQIANNRFAGTVDQAVSLQSSILDAAIVGKLQTGRYTEVDIYGNVFERVDSALVANLDDDAYQSESLCFFNNTIVESGASGVGSAAAVVDIAGVSQLELFNNIIFMPQGEILVTRSPGNVMRTNSLEFSDYNLFGVSDSLNWRLDKDGANDTFYADLVSWQGAKGHPDFLDPLVNPDVAILPGTPDFIDPINGDYRLLSTSPALLAGRFGMSIGADHEPPVSIASIANDCIRRVY